MDAEPEQPGVQWNENAREGARHDGERFSLVGCRFVCTHCRPPLRGSNDGSASYMFSYLYFAYGSNLYTPRLRARLPSARWLETGILPGYRLHWRKAGGDGSGKCGIERTGRSADRVFGVVYRIGLPSLWKLDRIEGVGAGYERIRVRVETRGSAVSCMTYYPTRIDPALVPWDWYKALVVAGAEEHGFPAWYRNTLASVPEKHDEQADRSGAAWRLIAEDSTSRQRGR